jgi:ACR3 family arsenite efflux pump ArsB
LLLNNTFSVLIVNSRKQNKNEKEYSWEYSLFVVLYLHLHLPFILDQFQKPVVIKKKQRKKFRNTFFYALGLLS